MSEDELERRKQITFLQAEGEKPLPSLCSGTNVTDRFRVFAYDILLKSFGYVGTGYSGANPTENTRLVWKGYFARYVDELPNTETMFNRAIKEHIVTGANLLDLIQFCARTKLFSADQFSTIQKMLSYELIGFRFIGRYGDRDITLMPSGDEAETIANQEDYAELRAFPKSREHFRQAVEELKSSHFRGSVAESISGVESIIKTLSGKPSVTFGVGLNWLEKEAELNPTLKAGLDKIYGWTNSPSGMRHALIDGSKDVTEAEARFMLSACLAFAAWLKRSFPKE